MTKAPDAHGQARTASASTRLSGTDAVHHEGRRQGLAVRADRPRRRPAARRTTSRPSRRCRTRSTSSSRARCSSTGSAPDNPLAAVGDPNFPYVITTYRLTEHYLAGAMSRWLPWLAELQPELFVEISPELARGEGHREPRLGAGVARRAARDPGQGAGHPAAAAVHDRRQDDPPGRHAVALGLQGLVTGDVVNELTALVGDPNVIDPRRQGVRVQRGEGVSERMPEPMGFFTDTTVCIGCKACEVACKEWNQLPATNGGAEHAERRQLRQHRAGSTASTGGTSSSSSSSRRGPQRRPLADDERRLQALRAAPAAWRSARPARSSAPSSTPSSSSRTPATAAATASPPARSASSTSTRSRAPRRSARSATTGSRSAWSRRAPRPARPSRSSSGRSRELQADGRGARRAAARRRARAGAYLYGADDKMLGGLNSFYLLVDKPEVYGLPPDPKMPTRNLRAERRSGRRSARVGDRPGRASFNFRNGRTRAEDRRCLSTFFTAPPHWHWLIVCYFFLGGLAGGCYFLAALIDLFGRPRGPAARPARLLHRLPAAVIWRRSCLIVDLERPERFWHMLIQSRHAGGRCSSGGRRCRSARGRCSSSAPSRSCRSWRAGGRRPAAPGARACARPARSASLVERARRDLRRSSSPATPASCWR